MNSISGIFKQDDANSFIEDASGQKHFYGHNFWKGYLNHFSGTKVNARILPYNDYITGENMILVWPCIQRPHAPFIEIYYCESLKKYPKSILGHLTVNVDGVIYNYSVERNENEIITPEEYFYRPALGEFGPGPGRRILHPKEGELPYYDKFGRLFMRSILVLHIQGIDTSIINEYFKTKTETIRNTPLSPIKPEIYKDFSIISNSCTTIIRDGLRASSYNVSGILPLDFFINASYYFINHKDKPDVSLFRVNQLKVEEAQYSKISKSINFLNWSKYAQIKRRLQNADYI